MSPADPTARRGRRRPRVLLLALPALLIAGALAIRMYFLRPGGTDPRQLAGQVAARPDAPEPRIALAGFLADQRLTFGVAMELSLLPEGAFPEARAAAAAAFERIGVPDRALSAYEEVLRTGPEPDVAVRQVALLRQTGRLWEARSAAAAAASRWPDHAGLAGEQARCLMDVGEHGRAAELLQRRLAGAPENYEARLLLGWTRLLQGDAAEALALLSRLPGSPPNAWAEVLRGRAALGLGRPADAAASFRRAAGIDPALPEAQLGLAEAAGRQGDWRESLQAARRAAALRPSSAGAWELQAKACAAAGEALEAEWCRGRAELAAERPEAALSRFRRAWSARPDPRYAEALAQAQARLNDLPGALRTLEAAASRARDPLPLRFWYTLLYDKRRFQEAFRPAKLLSEHPDPRTAGEGHGLLGQALREARDLQGAEAAFSAGLARQPGDPVLLAERGRTRLQAYGSPDRFARAREDLERAAASTPPIAPLYRDLAEIELEEERPWPAFLHLNRSLTLLGGRELHLSMNLLARACARLRLTREVRWLGQWVAELNRAEDRLRVAVAPVERTPARDREILAAALGVGDAESARAAALRLTQAEPGRAEHWRSLARACQVLGLYDERVAAVARSREAERRR